MTSLLASAAFFEASDVEKPRQRKNNAAKTIKKRPSNKSVEALMNITADSDDDGDYDDFKPMKPELTRVPQTRETSQEMPMPMAMPSAAQQQQLNRQPTATPSTHIVPGQQSSYQYTSVPSNYGSAHQPPQYLSSQVTSPQGPMGDMPADINSRLNHIIHLLEEQQNTKTSTTTEELILYSFLGVFTIYIVDSFTKVGKTYSR
jgi:hypothetical protein